VQERFHGGLCALALAATLCACRGAHGEPSAEPVDVRAAPEQEPLAASEPYSPPEVLRADVKLTPQARYRIAARVLSTERYYLGWQADVVPVDLALGWGAMSDPAVDEWIDWYQRGRYYFWQWDAGSPFQNAAIRAQSANVHVVPGTKNLRRALLKLDPGDEVRLSGHLVNLVGPAGAIWNTSLSRTDTGGGSCELLHVTELATGGRVYR
jgi:hypothetical protein